MPLTRVDFGKVLCLHLNCCVHLIYLAAQTSSVIISCDIRCELCYGRRPWLLLKLKESFGFVFVFSSLLYKTKPFSEIRVR